MTQYYLILDIETMGLPKNFQASVEDLENWPDILEIGWQLYNDNRELIQEESILVQPTNGMIPEEIILLTGISSELAINNGYPIKIALTEFTSVVKKFNPILVAHNCDFDLKVIQANLLKNMMDFSIMNQEQVCTMKTSTLFCNLPNLKYPKLKELYEALFSDLFKENHRALLDVQATSKSFFKLLDLNIISIENKKSTIPCELINLNTTQIKNAISDYINDLNNYPLFYDLNKISILKNTRINERIIDRFNKYYQTGNGTTFEIPYNLVSNRDLITLEIEDIIIRYILINHLRDQTNFIPSNEKYNDQNIATLCQKEIEKGNSVSIKVDISNCYESISHDKLVNEVAKELMLEEESTYLTILKNALKVIYRTDSGEITKKEKGLLIGSKPDEFLAEFFLEKIEEKIKKQGIYVIRVADEFIYFTDSILAAREKYKSIERIISEYGLSFNKSKTIINDYRGDALTYKLNLVREYTPFVGSNIDVAGYTSYRLSRENMSINNENGQINIINSNDDSEKNIEIESYDSSVLFLRQMLKSEKEIKNYQEKHPNFKYLHNIIHSQPTSSRNDFYNLDYSVFSIENIEKLKKIIYHYPKGEYYNALAIQLLTFIATNAIHVNYDYDDKSQMEYLISLNELEFNLHQACELANLTIVELLKSEDVHEYQKYILLRCLFKKEHSLDLDIEKYRIQTLNYDLIAPNGELPFKDEVIKDVYRLAKYSNFLPLKMICKELENINLLLNL